MSVLFGKWYWWLLLCYLTGTSHSCQPLLGINLSPEFVNLYFPYAGRDYYFLLVAAAFWIQTGTCDSGRKKQCCANLNTHAQLQISLPMWFLSLLALGLSVCIWGWCALAAHLTVFLSFAQFNFKTTTKSHENYVFLYPFSSMAISPQNNGKKMYFILVNCMGWQVWHHYMAAIHVLVLLVYFVSR